MTNEDFDAMSQAGCIASAIDKVLEQQQIEWVKKGISPHLTYSACLIALSQCVYSEIANHAAMNCAKNIEDFKDKMLNEICTEAENARISVLNCGKNVLGKQGTWSV